MKSLDRKLLRDLRTLRWQIVSIALVVASGVVMLVSAVGTYRSLEGARARFYDATAFADVFVRLARAPDSVASELAHLHGVAGVETRLSFDVPLEAPGAGEPLSGRVLSLPPVSHAARTRLHLVRGRLPDAGARNEVAVNEAFAAARHLVPGDTLVAVLHGRREDLDVVGVVLSPEHIAALRPGEVLPDDERYGVLWVPYETLAASYDARGTFNEAVLWLAPGAREHAVLAAVDRLLAPFGGYGATGRAEQPAHRFIDGELEELEVEATVIPFVFLGVAAFLLNVVLARLVAQERTQIATLRALGMRVRPIVAHYLELAVIVALAGATLGLFFGMGLGVLMTDMYSRFFRFPDLRYEPEPLVVLLAYVVSVLAGVLGALGPVRRIARLAPAEAMQPRAPHAFEAGWVERAGIARRLPVSLRLVVRNVTARPMRTASAMVGVASAMGILVVGAFWGDAIDALLEHQFRRVQHEDVVALLTSPRPERAARELAHVPGVRIAEGARAVPARLSHERRSRRIDLLGLPPGGTLRRLVDRRGREVALPADGLVLSRHLAEVLDLRAGEHAHLDVLEGERAARGLRVALVVDEPLGMSAYIRSDALGRLLGEAPSISVVFLAIEPGREVEVHRALRRFPGVGAATVTSSIVRRFEETMAEIILVFSAILTLLGALVVIGVVYNATRLLVAEREREFATLRVMGFTRGDVSESLFLELAVQVLPALGLGALFGYALAAIAVQLFGPEDMSIPLVVGARTWGLSLAVVLASAVGSALAVRGRLDRLDLVGVLKVRE